jgi:hypothetical protein
VKVAVPGIVPGEHGGPLQEGELAYLRYLGHLRLHEEGLQHRERERVMFGSESRSGKTTVSSFSLHTARKAYRKKREEKKSATKNSYF